MEEWTCLYGNCTEGKKKLLFNCIESYDTKPFSTRIDDHHSLKMIYEPMVEQMGVTVEIADKTSMEKNTLAMTALAFSDSHGIFAENPQMVEAFVNAHRDYSVVFILGDCTRDDVTAILNVIPLHVPVLAVAGNHNEKDFYDEFQSRIVDVHGKVVNLKNGVTVCGLGGVNRYKRDNPKRMMFSQDESIFISKVMEASIDDHIETIDILLSHDKAFTKASPDRYYSHTGLIGITRLINLGVTYHVFGHYHEEESFVYLPSNTIGHCVYLMRYLKL